MNSCWLTSPAQVIPPVMRIRFSPIGHAEWEWIPKGRVAMQVALLEFWVSINQTSLWTVASPPRPPTTTRQSFSVAVNVWRHLRLKIGLATDPYFTTHALWPSNSRDWQTDSTSVLAGPVCIQPVSTLRGQIYHNRIPLQGIICKETSDTKARRTLK